MRQKIYLLIGFIIISASAVAGGVAYQQQTIQLSAAASGSPLSNSLLAGDTPVSSSVDIDELETDYRDAVSVVAREYVGEIDYAKANQAAIQGMLMTLDPHSSFFPTDDFRKLKEDQESRFYGIGVSILRHRDGVYVQSPVEGTPAQRAGLRFGDRIVEVDGKDAREWSASEVSKNVRGVLGTDVTLKVERAGEQAPVFRTITRDAVSSPSIRAVFMAQPGTGYVGLTGSFQRTTESELRAALASLQKQGARQIILDLRNNPGGLLDQSISVAGQFLPRDATIVTVRGRDAGDSRVYKNTEAQATEAPLIVLINRNSASASEIVAGAIQDYGRGLVVGENSFGKGLVQRVFQLPFGNGLTLTTAKYYTPFGRLIQREYETGSFYDYYVRHNSDAPNTGATTTTPNPTTPANRTLRQNPTLTAPAPAASSVPTPQPTPNGTPVRTSGGRTFYSGNGITPDYEVKPLDLSGVGRGRIYEAAFLFVRQLAAGQIKGLEGFRVTTLPGAGRTQNDGRNATTLINDAVIVAFRDFVSRDSTLALTPKQIDTDLDFTRLRIADEYATAAFGADAATRVLLDNDPQLRRALELFPDARRLAESVRANTAVG